MLQLAEFAAALGHEVTTAGRDTDLYVQARRTRRLTLTAEMQWQLLPGRGCARQEYVIGAHLEPAYAIGGDNFDWSASADHLTVTVTDGMGQGIDAALLTSLTVGADLESGTVHAVDAGSPQLYRQRGATIELIELEAQLPLGMLEETPYEEQTFHVAPGDRLIVVSTGVHGTASAHGDLFGRRALRQILSATATMPPHETARAVVSALTEHFGSKDLTTDAAVV
ncbi:PP2C family protein-serine/threonine phosphatase [Streptomyces sp. NPDC000070]|uniref:PP2C family protein-serine/threonine phosphatase n=1 Tax=Streptomyces sp. NPDC000070 TaxID=3154240 RepID=UPI0033179259